MLLLLNLNYQNMQRKKKLNYISYLGSKQRHIFICFYYHGQGTANLFVQMQHLEVYKCILIDSLHMFDDSIQL